jgi:hypothetical protein
MTKQVWEARFWRMMREALYEDMAGPLPAAAPVSARRPFPVSHLLTPGDIAHIRFRYAHGEHQKVLAREFGVSQVTISEHVRGVVRLCGRGSGIRKVQAAGMAA